ncbi:MAG TPA: HAMP domain-containing sensor histidine kinase [Cyclobacteriaceae bacterium]|nr:HAMP domain-containing sensor histidine kinase [Cyclobacteriaceae bacterium]HRJ81138.1 HAMP domain-containing sensor histidine kinase [Cyclobacteriaceae bacterium]
MTVSFKNRIAFSYLAATALLVALVFITIFMVIRNLVYGDLENILSYEAIKHQKEIMIESGRIRFINRTEMEEREHREVEVNPVFIQLVDAQGVVRDKSPNLKENSLAVQPDFNKPVDSDYLLNGKRIRQRQIPVTDQGKTVGYIVTAISSESAEQLLGTLQRLLLGLYPVVLLVLFGTTRWLAGRSIVPVKTILETTNRITESNLNERISLPAQKDELFHLTNSINQLLGRIESALEREKQFTADASHELRTPLAVLRGTLEVLIRKPRTPEEYVEKVEVSIREIDRMHVIVEQLLLLARFDHPAKTPESVEINVNDFIADLINRHQPSWSTAGVTIKTECSPDLTVQSDPYLLEVILENLISNAVKYSPQGKEVIVRATTTPVVQISVSDQGIGIDRNDHERIFQPFYRSDALHHKSIKGIGLGLSLVQKACAQLSIKLTVESELNKGSTFTLRFPE